MRIRFNTIYLLVAFAGISISTLPAQENEDRESLDLFALDEDYDTPLTIDLEAEEEEEETKVKKKKRKKKVFYGIKTKKGYTRQVSGNEVIIEFFHYLKVPQHPDPYVRDIYWYDFKRRKIFNSHKIDPKYGVILHGPYKKAVGEQVLEEGIFYIGSKHGRWIHHNKDDILITKDKYYKGWPKESKVAYYDRDRKQLQEVIPVEHGEREGFYYYFHENGSIAAMGEFKFDAKVGIWNEFYDAKNRRKRQIQYPIDPFDHEFRPFIIREWNKYGKIIYDRSRDYY